MRGYRRKDATDEWDPDSLARGEALKAAPARRGKCGVWRDVTLLYSRSNFPDGIDNPARLRLPEALHNGARPALLRA